MERSAGHICIHENRSSTQLLNKYLLSAFYVPDSGMALGIQIGVNINPIS